MAFHSRCAKLLGRSSDSRESTRSSCSTNNDDGRIRRGILKNGYRHPPHRTSSNEEGGEEEENNRTTTTTITTMSWPKWRPNFLIYWTQPVSVSVPVVSATSKSSLMNNNKDIEQDAKCCYYYYGAEDEESILFLFLQGILSILSLLFVGIITFILIQEEYKSSSSLSSSSSSLSTSIDLFSVTPATLIPGLVILFLGALGLHQLWDLLTVLQYRRANYLHRQVGCSTTTTTTTTWFFHLMTLFNSNGSSSSNRCSSTTQRKTLRFKEGTKFTRGRRPRRKRWYQQHFQRVSSEDSSCPTSSNTIDQVTTSTSTAVVVGEESSSSSSSSSSLDEIRTSVRLEKILRIMEDKMVVGLSTPSPIVPPH